MRRLRLAEQALTAAARSPLSQQYVCRACLAQAARQFHTTQRLRAEKDKEPFFKRMQNAIFGGSKAGKDKKSKALQTSGADEVISEEAKTVKLNGVEYEVAAVLDPRANTDYVPSSNWDGLESVGGPEWVKERLDMGEKYIGFRPREIINLSNANWISLLHHITVEVAALRANGRDVLDVCNKRLGESKVDAIANTDLVNDTDTGALQVQFKSPGDEKAILEAIPESYEKAGDLQTELLSIISAERAEYTDVEILDPTIKFAILKRALQLTGKRIPDFHLSTASSLQTLVQAFGIKEKPKKLSQHPQVQQLEQQLPNVRVHETKRTLVDKETEIGRWKVIEEELAARDLPVFGTRWKHAKEGVRLLKP